MTDTPKDTRPSRPDLIRVYRDIKGEWRWTRRNGWNGEVVADSAEGYTSEAHTIEMAYSVNGGAFTVEDAMGRTLHRKRKADG